MDPGLYYVTRDGHMVVDLNRPEPVGVLRHGMPKAFAILWAALGSAEVTVFKRRSDVVGSFRPKAAARPVGDIWVVEDEADLREFGFGLYYVYEADEHAKAADRTAGSFRAVNLVSDVEGRLPDLREPHLTIAAGLLMHAQDVARHPTTPMRLRPLSDLLEAIANRLFAASLVSTVAGAVGAFLLAPDVLLGPTGWRALAPGMVLGVAALGSNFGSVGVWFLEHRRVVTPSSPVANGADNA